MTEVPVATPYGPPSAPVRVGQLDGIDVAFMPRHGDEHTLPPHRINYRANIWAMKEVGADRIIGPSACGSLKPELGPGTFVLCDQFVDRTAARESTFYDGPQTTHVSAADPYCPDLRGTLAEAAREEGVPVAVGGTVVVIEGPRFSTRAESRWLLALSPGNQEMQDISTAVQEGAQAYLRRQYSIIAGVAVVLAIVLAIGLEAQDANGILVAIGFLIGGTFSGAAGFIGMNVSVRANARVAESARSGVSKALEVAFKGGAVTGMLVAGLALLGVAGYYGILILAGTDERDAIDALIGLGFGGSLISVFARLGGGIFTKAADVGADLVGKIEAGIPEDDPRNPAVIADNVGDNVGDCAGMAADLFETYAVTAVAVMLLGVITFTGFTREVAIYPLAIGAVAIIASIIGALSVRTRTGNVEAALYRGLAVSAVLSAAAFYPVTKWLMDDPLGGGALGNTTATDLWLCGLIGVGVTAMLFILTDYYTSTRFRPVRTISRASQTGHATNIIQGLAQGLQSTALPVLVLALAILGAWKLAGGGTDGIYGIGVAVMAQLSLTGLIVALDAFGPITDNAGGIAEMADLPQDVRDITDPLDAVGNTTKAGTKGNVIGSAVLAALVLFAAFVEELLDEGERVAFPVDDPAVLMGLLL